VTHLLFAIAVAAFEPQSESPWLSGGAASALFPRTHLALCVNPSSIGLLTETAFAVSASRPFGFRELDRTAAAGGWANETLALAGYASYSGRNGYSEATGTAAGAFTLARGLVAGASASYHRLSIQGYGGAGALSTDIGLTARPITGVYLAASCRGLYSSAPATDGMGAVPRTLSGAIGICPCEGVTLSGGASFHQYSGEEFSGCASVEPYPGVTLAASVLTPPVRMGFSLHVSISSAGLQYGYNTHPDLQSGHSICLSYGGSGFKPAPVEIFSEENTPPETRFPLNVNAATQEQLIEIPGIGPAKASAIRNYIENNGPLQEIDELIEVPGIGPATLENLRPYLTI
jgi:competence ComEA-like helix-hairpin-helix protein